MNAVTAMIAATRPGAFPGVPAKPRMSLSRLFPRRRESGIWTGRVNTFRVKSLGRSSFS
jgi:hypothetical protein